MFAASKRYTENHDGKKTHRLTLENIITIQFYDGFNQN